MNNKTQQLFEEYESLSNKAKFIYDIICTVNDKLKNDFEWYSEYIASMYNLPGHYDDFLYFTIECNKPCVISTNKAYDSFEIEEFELDLELFELDTREEIEEYWTNHLIIAATKAKERRKEEEKRRKSTIRRKKKDNDYKTYLKLKKKFEKEYENGYI